MIRWIVASAIALAALPACGGRSDRELTRRLIDAMAARVEAAARGGLNVRPCVLSIDASGSIDEWSCDPGFGNVTTAEPDDELCSLLERASQKCGHRAIVRVGFPDLDAHARTGAMVIIARDTAGVVTEERRSLPRRVRVELPIADR